MTIDTQTTLLDDDLFARPPRHVLRVLELCQVVCLVCGLPTKIPIDAPAKLCHACASDLVLTRNGIEARLEALDRRAEAVRDLWLAAQNMADAETMQRWEKASEAGVAPPVAFAKTWVRRREEGSHLADLLCDWETMQAECESIERQRTAEQRALEEVERANGD